MQILCSGKTNQGLSRFKFPEPFSLSVNLKHYSNTPESIKIIDEVIIPYVNAQREILSNPTKQLYLFSTCFAVRSQMKLLRIYYKTTLIWHSP